MNSRWGAFAVRSDLEAVRGGDTGRYCHFSFGDEAYRIRDFIAGRNFHPPGKKVSEPGLTAAELPMTALAASRASRGRVRDLGKHGLRFPGESVSAGRRSYTLRPRSRVLARRRTIR